MCGIVGYKGRSIAAPILLKGLKNLEYRGYDSAGIATLENGINVVKTKGRITNLSPLTKSLCGTAASDILDGLHTAQPPKQTLIRICRRAESSPLYITV